MKKIILSTVLFTVSLFSFSQDLLVTALFAPLDACQLSNAQTINCSVWNSGPSPHGGPFTVNYSLNGGPVVTANSSTSIAFNAVYNFSFPIPDDFSACQAHDLKIWVNSTLDPNHANDTIFSTVISDCPAVSGTISGPALICEGNNSGTLTLTGYTGNVIAWESSPNGVTWTTFATTDDFYNFTNLPGAVIWRAIVDSPFGICGPDTTGWFTILADAQSDAGTVSADFDVCDNGNSGFIFTTGIVGTILDWNLSTNSGGSWIPLSNPDDSLAYNNLVNTTHYQVIVLNGVCPADTSAWVTLTVVPGTSAGTIAGPTVICNFENADSLVACCGYGSVIGWNVSTDGGVSWQPTLDVDSVFNFSGLTTQTWFEAVWQFGACPTESTSHQITVLPVINTLTPDTTINENDIISLIVCCGISYLWWPDQFIDDVNSATPIVNPDSDITYFVEVTTIEGCKDTARVRITVLPDLTTLVVPNLITPNADGYNDFWEILNIQAYAQNELTIFNIYGQVVYEAAPYNNEWEGQFGGSQLPDGTYFYLLNLNDVIYNEPIQGTITLASGSD